MTKHAYTVEFEKSVLKRLLGTNENWAKKALMRIYDAQTCDEKRHGETMHDNGVGFTGTYAKLLTRIANGRNVNASGMNAEATLFCGWAQRKGREYCATRDIVSLRNEYEKETEQ